jgi:flagellar assembly factor FliW
MPDIKINGKDHSYTEDQIIEFAEGLIGMPRLRRAALVESDEYAPFCWLASLDDENVRFVVVDPCAVYPDYETEDDCSEEEDFCFWAIVKVSSDWQKTTVNLRAPIFVDKKTRRGGQVILTESEYKLEETLPLN